MNYFTQEDLNFYIEHANTVYDKENQQDIRTGSRIRKTIFDKVSFWGEQVAKQLGFSSLGRNNWLNTYQSTFKEYAWCRIFPNPDDHQLFFNVECNAEEGSLIIKLHCKFSGSDRLSHDKVALFDKFVETKFYRGQWIRWYLIDLRSFQNFDQLINFSKHFIQDNLHHYFEIKNLLDSSDLKEELENLHLDSMDLTQMKLTKVENNPLPQKSSRGEYVFQDKTLYFNVLNEPSGSIYEKRNRENKKLGDTGEKLILIQEEKRLKELQEKGIISKDKRVIKQKDYVGYDFLSYDENGQEIHIEVKTTAGNQKAPFYMSMNEVSVMKSDPKWKLYRVYDFNAKTKTANFFIWDAVQVELNIDFFSKTYYCCFK